MNIWDVYDKVIKGKRICQRSRDRYLTCFRHLEKYTSVNCNNEFPTEKWQIHEWIASIQELNDTSINKTFKMIKSACNYMISISPVNDHGQSVFPNPFAGIKNPEMKMKDVRIFDSDEIYKIVKSCVTQEERLLVLSLLDSGCRISELWILNKNDIHDGYFSVSGKVTGKGGVQNHRLGLELCNALRAFAHRKTGVVFHKPNGERYFEAGWLTKKVKRVFKRCGMDGKRLGAHTLRHSVGTLIAEKTGSTLAVKAVLGHSKEETSHRYMHNVEDKLAQKLSPLAILGQEFKDEREVNPQYLMLGDGNEDKAVVDGSDTAVTVTIMDEHGVKIVSQQDLVADMFINIPDGVKIRPLLSSKDLNLIRNIAVEFTRANRNNSMSYEVQELLKRMLRKVGE